MQRKSRIWSRRNPLARFGKRRMRLAIRALLLNCLEEHYGSLANCVVNPDRAVQSLRNIQLELERVKDLL